MAPSFEDFLTQWHDDSLHVKPFVNALYELLSRLPDVQLEFKARPGISYSLRAKHVDQHARPLFVLVDIIDDEPKARWISMCFYDSFITDPDELGDQVPGGLLGEDARCFDVDAPDADHDYLCDRIVEAYKTAEISD